MSLMPPLHPEPRKGLSGRTIATIIGLLAGVVVVALLAGALFIDNLGGKPAPKPLNALQYGVVLGPDGSITNVIHGPFKGNKDVHLGDKNFIVFYDDKEITNLNGQAYGTVIGEVTIGGESILVGTDYDVSISLDDAVTYFNQRVKEGNPLKIPFETSSLERLVIDDAIARIEQASDLGKLTEAKFETVGLPTIAYDEEAATQYANEQAAEAQAADEQAAAQAAVAQENIRRQQVINAICADHPEMAHEELVSICGPEVPTPEPGAPTPDHPAEGYTPPPPPTNPIKDPTTADPGVNNQTPLYNSGPSYDFMCSSTEVALTNWKDLWDQYKVYVGNDLISFTTPENTSVTQKTDQPCAYFTGATQNGDGNSSENDASSPDVNNG